MRRASGKSSKVEHATTIAIHLSKILQSLRHPVGLVAYDEFKTLTTIEPTNNYTKFFEALTSIPEQIHTKEYVLEPFLETEENTVHNREEHQQFLSTVFPFLAKGKRTINHPAQASGIYEAVHHLLLNKTTKKHLIVITDLETDLASLYQTMHLAHSKHFIIWLLTSFTPSYHLDKTRLTTEQLEKLYELHTMREKLILKLKKMKIDIVELTPQMDGRNILEHVRGKKS
jgi:cellulose biosynthesis protein BcsQ